MTIVPIVLILGDADRAEMRPLVAWLNEHVFPSARPMSARDVKGAANGFAADEFPDLIVVLQSWSNEYSTEDVNRLLSFAPLARVVVCFGSWCESDGRNHNVWPLSVRIPVWAAVARIEREWRLIQDPGEIQPLPWSASREEVFAADHPPLPLWPDPQSIVVDSPDQAYRKFLDEMLVATGHTVGSMAPTILLFDADPWGPARATALQELREQYPRADVVVLMSLAEPSLVADFQQIGIRHIIHKLGFP